MTTAHSPLRVLKAQADRMAASLKAAERGEIIASDPGAKIQKARGLDSIRFAVVMDDKVLTIEMTWATIRWRSEAGIAEFILNEMRKSRDQQTNKNGT
jgi:hypothetical protein